MIFRAGRRTGTLNLLRGLENPDKREAVLQMMTAGNITSENIDAVCDNLLKRFI